MPGVLALEVDVLASQRDLELSLVVGDLDLQAVDEDLVFLGELLRIPLVLQLEVQREEGEAA